MDAGSPVVLLSAVTSLGAGRNYEYVDASGQGRWVYQSAFGGTAAGTSAGLGGLTFLADGSAVSVFSMTNTNSDVSFGSSVWNGTAWAASSFQTSFNGTPGDLDAPVATATGAAVAYVNQEVPPSGIGTFNAAVYAEFAGGWAPDTSFPASLPSSMTPVVAVTSSGDPLVLVASGSTYSWLTRTAGVWSTPVAVPGVTVATVVNLTTPAARAVLPVGGSQVVAVFQTGSYPTVSLQLATFSAGTWSAPVTFATDVYPYSSFSSIAMAAMPDGSVALGYTAGMGTQTSYVNVGFWDGTSWGPFQASPFEQVSEAAPFALAPGVGGAVLELVWGSGMVSHARLMDAASWTWTVPVYVDTGTEIQSFSIASQP